MHSGIGSLEGNLSWSGPRELVGHGRLRLYRDGPDPVPDGEGSNTCKGRRQSLCRDARGPGRRGDFVEVSSDELGPCTPGGQVELVAGDIGTKILRAARARTPSFISRRIRG